MGGVSTPGGYPVSISMFWLASKSYWLDVVSFRKKKDMILYLIVRLHELITSSEVRRPIGVLDAKVNTPGVHTPAILYFVDTYTILRTLFAHGRDGRS
jgi:hypothetical protein